MIIGWETDYLARNVAEKMPLSAHILSVFFCFAFFVELVLRCIFRGTDWKWNIFDCVLVGLQVVEVIMSFTPIDFLMNLSFIRLIRLMRIVRVVRVIRVVR